jgi:hypothetical protein
LFAPFARLWQIPALITPDFSRHNPTLSGRKFRS